MTEFSPVLTIIKSEKPKVSEMQCLVPSCDRFWCLRFGHQGFILAAGQSHARSHWRKYHAEHKHSDIAWADGSGTVHKLDALHCPLCAKASEEEYEKRCKEQNLI